MKIRFDPGRILYWFKPLLIFFTLVEFSKTAEHLSEPVFSSGLHLLRLSRLVDAAVDPGATGKRNGTGFSKKRFSVMKLSGKI